MVMGAILGMRRSLTWDGRHPCRVPVRDVTVPMMWLRVAYRLPMRGLE
jgi:hypothetical protein